MQKAAYKDKSSSGSAFTAALLKMSPFSKVRPPTKPQRASSAKPNEGTEFFKMGVNLMKADVLSNGCKIRRSDYWLGRGMFGVVYKGLLEDPTGQQHDVAIKFVESIAPHCGVEALLHEEQVFRKLSPHENIVKFFGCKSTIRNKHDSRYMVLEYIPSNLTKVLEKDSRFSTYRVMLKVMLGVARGMDHLQRAGITHHDLKPDNILMSKDLKPVLTDFGVSKIRQTLSMTAAFRGTQKYMAPESKLVALMTGDCTGSVRVIGESVDVYSFGVIMLECIMKDISQECSEDDGFVVMRHLVSKKVKCNCPLELRDLIQSCLRFNLDTLNSRDFGRPTCAEILDKISYILEHCTWLDDLLPWKQQ